MTAKRKAAWNAFRKELPWIKYSHRCLLEIASTVRGNITSGEDISVKELTLLRLCLSQLGATPSDATKITLPDDEKDKDPS
jgi:hypothetical protein